MNRRKNYLKVASDLFFVQGRWTKWFLVIITLVYIKQAVFALLNNNPEEDFYAFSFVSSNIYMFVIGIIAACVMLSYYVRNGVTRRDYFKGALLAVIGLSLAIIAYSLVITGLERLIIKLGNLPLIIDNKAAELFAWTDYDEGVLVAKIIGALVISPFIDLESNWLVSLVLACLNFVASYLIGWLIGAGYYRFGWLWGFGFIGTAIVLMVLWDYIWSIGFEISQIGSILGSVVFIVLVSGLIYTITSRVAIRL